LFTKISLNPINKIEMAKGKEADFSKLSKEELEAKLAEVLNENDAVKAENEAALKTIEEQGAALALAEKSGQMKKDIVVDSEGNEYTVEAPKFRHNKVIYTAEDLKANVKQVDKLVEIGSQVIKLIEKEEKN
jgi:hypothetical protein